MRHYFRNSLIPNIWKLVENCASYRSKTDSTLSHFWSKTGGSKNNRIHTKFLNSMLYKIWKNEKLLPWRFWVILSLMFCTFSNLNFRHLNIRISKNSSLQNKFLRNRRSCWCKNFFEIRNRCASIRIGIWGRIFRVSHQRLFWKKFFGPSCAPST